MSCTDNSGLRFLISRKAEDKTKLTPGQITTHHTDLLGQASNLTALESALQKVTTGLTQVDSGVDRLRAKIQQPCVSLSELLDRHDALVSSCELAKKSQRLVLLAKRLRSQLNNLAIHHAATDEAQRRAQIVEAALLGSDIEALRLSAQAEGYNLASVDALVPVLQQVEQDRDTVLQYMQEMLSHGLQQNVCSLESALWRFY